MDHGSNPCSEEAKTKTSPFPKRHEAESADSRAASLCVIKCLQITALTEQRFRAAEQQRPEGKLYSIQREMEIITVERGEGRWGRRVTQQLARQVRASNPTAADGSRHATTECWINSLRP